MTALDEKALAAAIAEWHGRNCGWTKPVEVWMPKAIQAYLEAAKPSEQPSGGACSCGNKWIGEYKGCKCFTPAKTPVGEPSDQADVLIDKLSVLYRKDGERHVAVINITVSEAIKIIRDYFAGSPAYLEAAKLDELMKGMG